MKKRILPEGLHKSILAKNMMGCQENEGMTSCEEKYLQWIEKFEKECEAYLIDIFGKLNICAVVKTDRYSLPYTGEVERYMFGQSDINSAFEFYRVARYFVNEILNMNEEIHKIRFYVRFYIEVDIVEVGHWRLQNYKVVYKFRYYVRTHYEKCVQF